MKPRIYILVLLATVIFADHMQAAASPLPSFTLAAFDSQDLTETGDKKQERKLFGSGEDKADQKKNRAGAGFWGGPYWGYGPRWGHPCQTCRSDCEGESESARCKRCRVRCGW